MREWNVSLWSKWRANETLRIVEGNRRMVTSFTFKADIPISVFAFWRNEGRRANKTTFLPLSVFALERWSANPAAVFNPFMFTLHWRSTYQTIVFSPSMFTLERRLANRAVVFQPSMFTFHWRITFQTSIFSLSMFALERWYANYTILPCLSVFAFQWRSQRSVTREWNDGRNVIDWTLPSAFRRRFIVSDFNNLQSSLHQTIYFDQSELWYVSRSRRNELVKLHDGFFPTYWADVSALAVLAFERRMTNYTIVFSLSVITL